MKGEPLHVKVVLRVKPEYQEAFERELMAVREKCIAENECLVFDVERRSDDPTVYLLVEIGAIRITSSKFSLIANIILLTSLR
jgi:hypothetical protein